MGRSPVSREFTMPGAVMDLTVNSQQRCFEDILDLIQFHGDYSQRFRLRIGRVGLGWGNVYGAEGLTLHDVDQRLFE